MRELHNNELALLQGGGQGRTCMIYGGIAFLSLVSTAWNPAGFYGALAQTSIAAGYGCFE